MSFAKRTADLASGSRDLFESGERNSPRHTCASERGSDTDSTGQSRSSALDFGCFRRPVVRSGGAIHRPGAPPRRTRFPAVEWVVARACPSPRRDAFWIGDSSRNTERGFGVASFHGTRSHDRGTRAEWNLSPAPRTLAAKANAAWTALRGCPGLATILGSHCRRSHRGPAAGSAAIGQREMLPAVAVPSTRRSGGRSH